MGSQSHEDLQPPLPSRVNVLIPVVLALIGFTLAFGALCRWMGVRRRRRLDRLEALQWEEGELHEPTIDYGEKPIMYSVTVVESSQPNDTLGTIAPLGLSACLKSHDDAPYRGETDRSYLSRFKMRFKRTDMKLSEDTPVWQGGNEVTIALLITMPSKETNEAYEPVLPELVLGVTGRPSSYHHT